MSEIYEFADFRLDARERILTRRGGERVALPDKAFETLCVLVRNAGRLVSKEEILKTVWAGSFVEENNLSKSVHAIRRALGENEARKFIETVKKHGFRFTADVERLNGSHSSVSIERANVPATVREFSHPMARVRAHSGSSLLGVAATPAVDELREEIPAAPKNVLRAVPRIAPTAGGRRRLYPILAVAFLAVIASGAVIYRYASPSGLTAPVKLAVLPLRPVIEQGRDTAIEFAVAESLIMKLGESKSFEVKRLNAVRKFVELGADAVDAGRELNVDYVLDSNYQIENGRIRITSQLIDLRTGTVEKTLRSEADMSGAFAMQEEVANEIGNAVFSRFGEPPTAFFARRGTDNEAAYNLYHEALFLIDKGGREDSARAVEILERAVSLDPQFAEAWAVKAQARCQFGHQGGGKPTTIFPIAEPDLQKALSLDPRNAVALAVRGTIKRDYHLNLSGATQDLLQAIEIDPNLALARRILAGTYYRAGNFTGAVEEQRRAVHLNPTGIHDKWFLGDYLIAAGKVDEGIAMLGRLTEIAPDFRPTYYSLWRMHNSLGDSGGAFKFFLGNKKAWNDSQAEIDRFQNIYEASGWHGVLRAELELMQSQDVKGEYSTRKMYMAQLAAQLGEFDTAFGYLEEAFQYRLIAFSYLRVDPLLRPLRDDPRYINLLQRSGL